MLKRKLMASATAIILTATMQSAVAQQEVELPRTLSVTTYDVGAASYNQAVALGTALGNAYDISLRVLPATSDVARLLPVRQGRVDFGVIGSESFNAAEGTEAFADLLVGPQPLRLVVGSNSDNCFTLGLRGDAGIDSIEDMKGKRVAYVVGIVLVVSLLIFSITQIMPGNVAYVILGDFSPLE